MVLTAWVTFLCRNMSSFSPLFSGSFGLCHWPSIWARCQNPIWPWTCVYRESAANVQTRLKLSCCCLEKDQNRSGAGEERKEEVRKLDPSAVGSGHVPNRLYGFAKIPSTVDEPSVLMGPDCTRGVDGHLLYYLQRLEGWLLLPLADGTTYLCSVMCYDRNVMLWTIKTSWLCRERKRDSGSFFLKNDQFVDFKLCLKDIEFVEFLIMSVTLSLHLFPELIFLN